MHGFVDLIAEVAVGAVDLFFLAEGHVTDGGPFGLEGFDGLLELLAAFVGQLLKAGDDVELFGEVGLLFFVDTGVGFFLAVEEGVASGVEALPNGIAHFVGHGADLFPLGLEGHKGVGGVAPVGAVFKFLGAFAQSGLLCEVVGEGFAETAEVVSFG